MRTNTMPADEALAFIVNDLSSIKNILDEAMMDHAKALDRIATALEMMLKEKRQWENKQR